MIIWIIGLSGSGKTAVGRALADRLRPGTAFLDGDLVREMMGNDLGHTLEERRKNADRICRICRWLDGEGLHAVCAILSLFSESREWMRQNVKDYFEVFLDAPADLLERRDDKGLYRAFREGKIRNVAGLDLPFPRPDHPDLVIRNDFTRPPAEIAEEIRRAVRHRSGHP